MLKYFLITTWRHLSCNKVYTAINILGLAIGIACGAVIYKIIAYESGFDSYHKNYANIYRLTTEYKDPIKGILYSEAQVHPLGEALRTDFPGVDAVMTFYASKAQITIENQGGAPNKFQENSGLVYAEPGIFRIFDFKFLAGDPLQALSNNGSIVLTSSLVQKYFKLPSQEVNKALGKEISIDNKTTFQITGIISDPPANTDLPFKIIAGYRDQTTSNPYYKNGTDWQEGNSATNCYLLLPDKISPIDFENQLVTFYRKYNAKASPLDPKYILQPFSELHSGICANYNKRQVPTKELIILGLIGLFLIVIASINFINLSTAKAIKRAKEIGIRKILGASRSQLIFQFLGETILISYIAAFIGLFIAHFLFIYLEDVIGYELSLNILKNPDILFFLIVTSLGVGLLSGFYPAVILAGMKPVGNFKNTSGSIPVRRVLVIAQFVISMVLIIGTLVMHKQLNYFRNKDMGFNKEAILIATLPETNTNKLQTLKSNLLQNPGINGVSYATRSPLADWRVNNQINYPTLEKDMYFGNLKTIDEDYLELFELNLIAGRNCTVTKNNRDAIVNRKLTKLLGFKDPNEALGEIFTYGKNGLEFTIIGVVEDFHAQSLQHDMDHVILSNLSFNIIEMAVKINPTTASLLGYKKTIEKVHTEWTKTFPDAIFDYKFFDQQIASLYNEEENMFSLIQLFACIAIVIGCLGLYGLISFIASQKIKEIGIRKVNGAKTSEIMLMLNKDFLKWVAIAFVIASPIAWYAMHKWLENIAYRTELSWWIFALAGFIAMGIALFTVSFQSWRAATRNPVEALRYE
jgi:putative ABC transport system permease protein